MIHISALGGPTLEGIRDVMRTFYTVTGGCFERRGGQVDTGGGKYKVEHRPRFQGGTLLGAAKGGRMSRSGRSVVSKSLPTVPVGVVGSTTPGHHRMELICGNQSSAANKPSGLAFPPTSPWTPINVYGWSPLHGSMLPLFRLGPIGGGGPGHRFVPRLGSLRRIRSWVQEG